VTSRNYRKQVSRLLTEPNKNVKNILVQKDSYHDSVFLMRISSEVKKTPGVLEAVVSMATAAPMT
jgi:hypothetical protein